MIQKNFPFAPFCIKLLVFILCNSLFFACKKNESVEFKTKNLSVTERFFKVSDTTNPLIIRVVNEIKRRNDKSEFVTSFSLKNGFPVWDKSLIQYPEHNTNTHLGKINNSESEESPTDTFAYIPIVQENNSKVNGFILAKISGGIDLLYSLAKDYKAFSFDSNSLLDLNDATKFVVTVLMLNESVFGIKEYKITDFNLFTDDPEHEKAGIVTLGGRLFGASCESISWPTVHCGTPNYCTSHFGAGGCDLCGTYCWLEDNTLELCTSTTVNWPSGGIGVGTSGGGPDGGGSDGGTGIPHYYPCVSGPQPLLPGDAPPCPEPGPGTGWDLPDEFYISWAHLENPIYVDPPPTIDNGIDVSDEILTSPLPPPRLIAHTRDRGNLEDMTHGTTGNLNGIDPEVINLPPTYLFDKMIALFHNVSTGDLKDVGDIMIQRFKDRLGGQFSDNRLDFEAANNSQTVDFIKKLGADIRTQLVQNGHDVNFVDLGQVSYHPVYNDVYNKFHGLQILLNDTEYTTVELTNSQIMQNGDIKIQLLVTIHDHFGLDKHDALAFQFYSEGFPSWWILQHIYDYVPFETIVTFPKTITIHF